MWNSIYIVIFETVFLVCFFLLKNNSTVCVSPPPQSGVVGFLRSPIRRRSSILPHPTHPPLSTTLLLPPRRSLSTRTTLQVPYFHNFLKCSTSIASCCVLPQLSFDQDPLQVPYFCSFFKCSPSGGDSSKWMICVCNIWFDVFWERYFNKYSFGISGELCKIERVWRNQGGLGQGDRWGRET